MKLVECAMNVSEGRESSRLERIAARIQSVPGVYLLEYCADADHHRSVFSFVGDPEGILEAAWEACWQAVELIDLRSHRGVHPRIGAVDVIPFIPLEGVEMQECVRLAQSLGVRLAGELGVPVYLYGEAATRPERKYLAEIRKGGFEGLQEAIQSDPARAPDYGPARLHPTAGAAAVGARGPLIAFNVFLDTDRVEVAREIAGRVREKGGGLPAVQALGFHLESRRQSQVSMNLLDFRRSGLLEAFERVRQEAARRGVRVAGSEIVGLVPAEALQGLETSRLRLSDFHSGQILEERIRQLMKEESS